MGSALSAAIARRDELAQGPVGAARRRQQGLNLPDGAETLAEIGGGRVYVNKDGTRGFVSPSYSTTDPETVKGIMDGGDPAAMYRTGIQEQLIDANPVAARGAVAVQGVPLVGEYADEAVGLFNPEAASNMTALQDAMRDTRPGQTTGLQVGGGIVGAAPLAFMSIPTKIAKMLPVSLAQKMGLGFLVGGSAGAIEGAVSGYGEDRAEGAKARGMFGGAIGGGVGFFTPAAGTVLRGVINYFSDTPFRKAATDLGVSPRVAKVLQSIAEATDDVEAKRILDEMGGDAFLADMSPAARGALDMVMQAHSRAGQIAADAIKDRAMTVGASLTRALDDNLGVPQGRMATRDQIRLGKGSETSDAYTAAYQQTIDYSTPQGQEIMAIVERMPKATLRKAVDRANDMLVWNEIPGGNISVKTAPDGSVSFDGPLTVAHLDYIKRGLDGVRRDGTDLLTGKPSSEAAMAGRMAKQLRTSVSAASPEYGMALASAADTAGRQEAVDIGYSVLRARTTREQAARATENMTPPEIEAVRLGVRGFIDDQIANVRRMATDPEVELRQVAKLVGDLSSDAARDKLSQILGRTAADNVLRELDRAGVAINLRAATTRNSATMGREAIKQSIDALTDGAGFGQLMAAGNPVKAAQAIVKSMTGQTKADIARRQAGLYAEIAEALVGLKGKDAERALNLLRGQNIQQPMTRARARAITKAFMPLLVAMETQKAAELSETPQ